MCKSPYKPQGTKTMFASMPAIRSAKTGRRWYCDKETSATGAATSCFKTSETAADTVSSSETSHLVRARTTTISEKKPSKKTREDDSDTISSDTKTTRNCTKASCYQTDDDESAEATEEKFECTKEEASGKGETALFREGAAVSKRSKKTDEGPWTFGEADTTAKTTTTIEISEPRFNTMSVNECVEGVCACKCECMHVCESACLYVCLCVGVWV